MVMEAVVDAFESKREEIRERAGATRGRLGAIGAVEPDPDLPGTGDLDAAVALLLDSADHEHGGFRGAPKFPPASALELLMARGETEAVGETLDAMLAGGIYDQVGGGFARYSVDATWTVPHFEKMLYDNALLARAYLHGWLVCGEPRLREVCEETLDWALREMRAPEGGFYSALDADSEGVEGKYYVWTLDALRDEAEEAIAYFGASEEGNFEGANILLARGPAPAGLKEIRDRLYAIRERRIRPGLDNKRLTSWNALMIAALADAGAALDRPDYVAAAQRAAEFVLNELREPTAGSTGGARGRLLRTYNDGRAKLGGYLEDHAYLLEALLVLYEATFEERWFIEARSLADTLIERFADAERGGFFSTPSDHEALIARRKDLEDSPIPAGNSSAALGLLRLAALTGEGEYERHAVGVLRLLHPVAARHPSAFGHLLQALSFHGSPAREVALVGSETGPLARVVRGSYRPHLVLAGARVGGGAVPLLAGREAVGGAAAAYVCESFSCRQPVTDPEELQALLDGSGPLLTR
jgi:uncharacterized protein YyaL (SSP411 family)